jgi:hypothetical protein
VNRLRDPVDGTRYLRTQPVLLLSFAVDIVAMVLAMPRAVFPEAAVVAVLLAVTFPCCRIAPSSDPNGRVRP